MARRPSSGSRATSRRSSRARSSRGRSRARCSRSFPPRPPEEPEPWEAIERDLDTLVEPNLTHWQHPGYLAYFANTGSAPGIVGDFLAAGYNQIGILWRTSPVLTELEQGVVRWLLGSSACPADASTASSPTPPPPAPSSRSPPRASRLTPTSGRPARRAPRRASSTHPSWRTRRSTRPASSSASGPEGSGRSRSTRSSGWTSGALEAAIAEDRAAGRRPVAVVATIGTTAVDVRRPVREIARVCEREGLWLHVDAAYAGAAASLPEMRAALRRLGARRLGRLNPHKWMFVPARVHGASSSAGWSGCARAFSVVPHYLETPERAAGVREYMDYGIQLGRRFRALKMWMTLRAFGVAGVRTRHRGAPRPGAGARGRAREGAGRRARRARPPSPSSPSGSQPAGLSPEASDAANRRGSWTRINAEGADLHLARRAPAGPLSSSASRSATCGPSGGTSRGFLDGLPRAAATRAEALTAAHRFRHAHLSRTVRLLDPGPARLRRPVRGNESHGTSQQDRRPLRPPIDRAEPRPSAAASSGPPSRPVVLAGVAARSSSPAEPGAVALRPPEVATTRIALVTPAQASTVLTASGYIVARSKAEISPEVRRARSRG